MILIPPLRGTGTEFGVQAVPLFILCAALAACSPAYVLRSWSGHRRLMSARRPIAEVLADPASPPKLKERLELVQAVRAFALSSMAMPDSGGYAQYSDVGRRCVTTVVTAAPKTSLAAHEWWFPVVGRVPYKGYFDEAGARAEEERLKARGLDTYLGCTRAYSTLGWWKDPVLSTMLEASTGALAEGLLHEMAHGVVYLRGQGDFNESMATYVGERGAEEFLEGRFGPASAELAAYRAAKAREEAQARRVEALARELEGIYASPEPEASKLERREECFRKARAELAEISQRPGAWPELNNAVVLAHRRYRSAQDDFSRARAAGGWPRFWELMRSLDRGRPFESLRERPS